MANETGGERPDESLSFETVINALGKGAVEAGRLYHEYDVGKRIVGSVAGIQTGLFFARFAGPKAVIAAPLLCTAGAVAGAIIGPEGIKQGEKMIADGVWQVFHSATRKWQPFGLPKPEDDPMDARYPHRLDL